MAVVWNVAALDTEATLNSLSDVVICVHWTASDADGDHTGSAYGEVALAAADAKSFTDIRKDNAVAWAKAALGSDQVAKIETSIAAQITESKTPTRSSGIPWDS